ncbi:MAG: hypothetical protein IKQ97_11230, partial [Eubacterium sp.]|nr:hypothetical protein [Eubacterium sp.]
MAVPVFILLLFPISRSASAEGIQKVSNRDELKKALGNCDTEVIELEETITVRETLVVRGRKTLTGPGALRRAITDNSCFGGSLLSVQGEALRLSGVTIDGRGDAPVLAGRLYGWLVEVNSGQLTIGRGTELKENKNSTKKSDGGGAVRVRAGGVCVMDGGVIRNNTCVTGGAGVRIDRGGVFYMKSGQITGNRVSGVGAVEGFDGRGGGVLNHGTAGFYGGSISGNSVTGVRSGGKDFGGVGGGLANDGDCVIQGTVIRGNQGKRGEDIGAVGGKLTGDGAVEIGEIWLKDGLVFRVGNGFRSGGAIRLIPDRPRAGLMLVSGLSGKSQGKYFSTETALREKGLVTRIHDGVMTLEDKPDPTPEPTPTPETSVVTEAPTASVPVTAPTEAPAEVPSHTAKPVLPSYLPVATADPEEEIRLVTLPPSDTATPTDPVEETEKPSGTTSPQRRSLPWYLIYPM